MIPNVDELLKILKESENDMKYNRVAPISTTFSDLRASNIIINNSSVCAW